MTIEHIYKEYPNLVVKDLAGGCNVYLSGNMVLTFWFKKRKWKSNKEKEWRRFADTEDALHLIGKLGNLQLKKRPVSFEIAEPVNTTQLCIDHINKKIGVIENVKGNNAVLMILKTLTVELEQYL